MKFDAILEKDKIVKFIKEYYKENNLGGAVLGISGGKDSAVVAALLVEALGKDNVVGLTLPCHSKPIDKSDAEKISEFYGFRLYNFDLTEVFDDFKKNVNNLFSNLEEETKNSDINLKPRLRMSSVYYFAALLSALERKTYLVIGTSNKCELYVGYFTKGGDSVHDLSPIADLTVSEVIKIGEVLNVPKNILYKSPSDGLSDMTDEDKLGVKYQDIELYLEDKTLVTKDIALKIEKLHLNAGHKFKVPTYLK